MSDRIVRALLKDANLLAVVCVATEVAREGRRRHGLAPSSAALLGEALSAGLMVASLQKSEQTRINLQVECDGPARGLFVDADPEGRTRGYIRNKTVRFPPEPRFSTAPLLGKTGYVSVLRSVDGELYRGAVGIESGDLSREIEGYFASSDQTDTTLQLEALATGDEELGWVGGVLIQRLPDGDADVLAQLREKLRSGAVEAAVRSGLTTAHALLGEITGGLASDLLADQEVQYFCPCSRERVFRALTVLPNIDLVEMITQEHKALVDCEFCGAHYEVTEAELREILDAVDRRDAAQEGGADRERGGGTLN